MPLDTRGIIAAVQLAIYLPITFITVALVFLYAFRRDAGWAFLLIFSLIRITDASLIIAGEASAKTQSDLYTAAYTLQAAGLAPLLLAPLGFIGLVGRHTFSEIPRVSRMLRFLGLLAVAALAFAIAGSLLGSPVAPSRGSTGSGLRRVGACLFGILYLLILFAHFGAFSYRWQVRSYRRKLLAGLFAALPPLGARSAYAVLAAWSSSDLYGRKLSNNAVLASLNPVTGKYGYYLGLSVTCEIAACIIYLISSAQFAKRRR